MDRTFLSVHLTTMRNLFGIFSIGLGLLCYSLPKRVLAAGLLQQQQTAFQRGLLALQQDHPEEALKEFTKAKSWQPNDANIHNFRGIVLAKLGRTTEAADEYREAIRLAPEFSAAYRNLGFLEWTGHRFETALTQLVTASRLAPDDNFARYYLGRVELELQQYDAAFRHLHEAGIPLPDDPEVLLRAAKGYSKLGMQAEEEEIVNRLASLHLPGGQTAQTAASIIALNKNDAAARLLQGWCRNNPHEDHEWSMHDLALTYLLAHRYTDAVSQAHQIVSAQEKLSPLKTASAWSLIGIANTHLHQQEQAVEAFRSAVSVAPSQEDHWLNLTRELMELSRFTDAITATHEAILAHPQSYALQLRLGAANLAVDRYAEAEAIFRKLLESGDPLPTSAIGLAQILLRTGRADEAVTELVQAEQRLGRSFLLSYFKGLAYNRSGKSGDAALAFRDAIQQNAQSAEAHFELGKTELKLSYFDASISELQKALELNGENLPASRLLKQAYQRIHTTAPIESLSDILPANLPSDVAEDFILPEWLFGGPDRY